jgi:hypothetical protein
MRILSIAVLVFCASASLLPAQNERKGAVEIGQATAQPGETVSVPLLATYDEPLRAIIVVFRFDANRLDFVRFGVDGSEAEGTDPLALLYRSFGVGGEGLCGINPQRVTSISHRYPPGARRHLGNLFFRVRPLAAPTQRLFFQLISTSFRTVCQEPIWFPVSRETDTRH